MNEELLIDVSQIIPIPESADYEIKAYAQAQDQLKIRSAWQELFRKGWAQYLERSKSKTAFYLNRSTT